MSRKFSRVESLQAAFEAHREAGYITNEVASLLKSAVKGIAVAESYVDGMLSRGTITEPDERLLPLLVEDDSPQ